MSVVSQRAAEKPRRHGHQPRTWRTARPSRQTDRADRPGREGFSFPASVAAASLVVCGTQAERASVCVRERETTGKLLCDVTFKALFLTENAAVGVISFPTSHTRNLKARSLYGGISVCHSSVFASCITV